MAINLKAKPFYLSDEDIKWVEETLANLTLDEKIGQVFVDMLWNNTEEEVVERIQKNTVWVDLDITICLQLTYINKIK